MFAAFDGDMFLKLALAVLIGASVGIERYIHGRAAGLRTYILVTVAFAAIAILSEKHYLGAGLPSVGGFRPDPARLVAGGLTGIGFLGAGIIIRSGTMVHGLTTAAAIWAVSVVGLAVGSGSFQMAAFMYVILMLSLIGLKRAEGLFKRDIYKTIEVTVENCSLSLADLESLLQENGLSVVNTDVSENCREQLTSYSITASGRTDRSFTDAYGALTFLAKRHSSRLVSRALGPS